RTIGGRPRVEVVCGQHPDGPRHRGRRIYPRYRYSGSVARFSSLPGLALQDVGSQGQPSVQRRERPLAEDREAKQDGQSIEGIQEIRLSQRVIIGRLRVPRGLHGGQHISARQIGQQHIGEDSRTAPSWFWLPTPSFRAEPSRHWNVQDTNGMESTAKYL